MILTHLVIQLGKKVGETLLSVLQEFGTFAFLFPITLTPLVFVGVYLESLGPTLIAAIDDPTIVTYDLAKLRYAALLFTWIGGVTMGYFYLRHRNPNEAFASFAIPAFFAVIGIWFCCLVALLVNMFSGSDFLRQRPPGGIFLVLFTAIWLACAVFHKLKHWTRWPAFLVVLVMLCGWVGFNRDFYLASAHLADMRAAPPEMAPVELREPAESYSGPPEPIAGTSAPTPAAWSATTLWPTGKWGLDGECEIVVSIARLPEGLRVAFQGNVENQAIVREEPNLIATSSWTFERAGRELRASAQSAPLGKLRQCP